MPLSVDHVHVIEILVLVCPLAQVVDGVGHGHLLAHLDQAGGHNASTCVLLVRQQFPHRVRLVLFHQIEDDGTLFLGEFAQDVRRVVGRHLLHQIRQRLVVHLLGDAEHLRDVHLRQDIGRQWFGQGCEDMRVLFFLQLRNEFGQVRRPLAVEYQAQRV